MGSSVDAADTPGGIEDLPGAEVRSGLFFCVDPVLGVQHPQTPEEEQLHGGTADIGYKSRSQTFIDAIPTFIVGILGVT